MSAKIIQFPCKRQDALHSLNKAVDELELTLFKLEELLKSYEGEDNEPQR